MRSMFLLVMSLTTFHTHSKNSYFKLRAEEKFYTTTSPEKVDSVGSIHFCPIFPLQFSVIAVDYQTYFVDVPII